MNSLIAFQKGTDASSEQAEASLIKLLEFVPVRFAEYSWLGFSIPKQWLS